MYERLSRNKETGLPKKVKGHQNVHHGMQQLVRVENGSLTFFNVELSTKLLYHLIRYHQG